MKKFTKTIMMILAVFLIAAPAMAGSPYVSLKGALGTVDTGDVKFSHIPEGLVNATDRGSSDTSKAAGLAVGYDTGAVRLEFEYMNHSKVEHDTSLAVLNGGITFNGTYYSFPDVIPVGGLNDIVADVFNIDAKIETETFFLNAYMESDTFFGYKLPIELYAGAGVGMAKHKTNVSYNLDLNPYSIPITASFSDADSNTCVAYNVTAGAAYLITDNIAIDLGLRYADLGQVELGSFLEADKMVVSEAVLSLRYTF